MRNLFEWAEELKNSGKLVVVEGKKDRDALENAGIDNVILYYDKPFYKLVENIYDNDGNGVVILTDLDKKGKQLYRKLKHSLQGVGVKVDSRFREFLFRKTKISYIESIAV